MWSYEFMWCFLHIPDYLSSFDTSYILFSEMLKKFFKKLWGKYWIFKNSPLSKWKFQNKFSYLTDFCWSCQRYYNIYVDGRVVVLCIYDESLPPSERMLKTAQFLSNHLKFELHHTMTSLKVDNNIRYWKIYVSVLQSSLAVMSHKNGSWSNLKCTRWSYNLQQ
jgi:calcineurin-like phosphoesterase family protein